MSAAIASRRRPSRIASAIGLVLNEQHAHARCYEPAHIAGVSKTAYVLATPRRLQWRRDLQRASTNSTPPDPDSQDPGRRPARRSRGGRRPRLSGRSPRSRGILVLRRQLPSRPPRRAPWSPRAPGVASQRARVGALGEADGAVPDGTTVFDDGVPGVAKLDPDLLGALRRAATDAAGDGVQFYVDSGWRSPAVPGAAPPRGDLEVRLRGGGGPLGGHPRTRPRT